MLSLATFALLCKTSVDKIFGADNNDIYNKEKVGKEHFSYLKIHFNAIHVNRPRTQQSIFLV